MNITSFPNNQFLIKNDSNNDIMKNFEINIPASQYQLKNEKISSLKVFVSSKKGLIFILIIVILILFSILIFLNMSSNSQKEKIIKTKKIFEKKLKTLGHINHIKYEIIGNGKRNIPKIQNEGLSDLYPQYGKSLSSEEHLKYNTNIYNENILLMSSDTTYDEIDENGNLILKGVKTGKKLYKHTSSIGIYDGDISNDEKSIIKKIYINPISNGNYITGLYAPPGEIIKYEISENDFEKIGNEISFLIGQCTQNNIISVHKNTINYIRMPILTNKLTYKKRIGYIGNFLGGPIYIQNPNIKNKFSITISNAIPYKHLIYGLTTKEEFNSMLNSTIPYFDIEIMDKSLRFSGPNSQIKNIDYDNIEKVIILWDKIYRTSKKIPHGALDNIGIHFIFDPYIAANGASGLAYIGQNWCQIPPNWANLALNYDYVVNYGAWGFIHELNHHFQKFGFSVNVQNEVTNNVVSLVEYSLYTKISSNRNEFSNIELTKSSGNHNFLNPEFSLRKINEYNEKKDNEIPFYDVIFHMFGYELFIKAINYGKGKGGVDIFYEALSETMEYDFVYYFENILGFNISDNIKSIYSKRNYPIFLPVASIYQCGRYYYKNDIEYFSNTSLPYKITEFPYILDFENHLIVPKGFKYEIISISNPKNGKITKLNDFKYLYEKHPNDNSNQSGIFNISIKLKKEGILEQIYKLGINLEYDTTNSIQIIYSYDNKIYNTIDEAYLNNFKGYNSINSIPNLNGYISNVENEKIILWEGKFKIEDDGYEYILYKGGRGSSFFLASFNNDNNYQKIGNITINQNNFQFDANAHYKIKLNKNDIIYFKIYLLTTSNNGNLYIGISKTNKVEDIKVLSSYNIKNNKYNYEKIEFKSGDYFPRIYQYDSSYFINYNTFEITSPNFQPWDDNGIYTLDKIFDGKTNTYMHTKKGVTINEKNPLTLIINCKKKLKFNQMILSTYSVQNYLPKSFTISISNDSNNWNDIKTFNNIILNSKTMIFDFEKIISGIYIKLHIFKADPQYISIGDIKFIEKEINYYELSPNEIDFYGNIEINNNGFPTYGQSYILNKDDYLKMKINCTGFKIKICQKNNTEIKLYIDNKFINEFKINDNDSDEYVLEIDGLMKNVHDIVICILKGKLDIDLVIYY